MQKQLNDANQSARGTSGDHLPSNLHQLLAKFLTCTKCQCLGAGYDCSVCKARYCSVGCQLEDWGKHRDICIPSLIQMECLGMPLPQAQQARQHGQQVRQHGQLNEANQIARGSSGDRFRPSSEFVNDVLRCTKCRCLFAPYGCSVCAARYCGEKCQVTDWKKHRILCLPSLIRMRSARMPLQHGQQGRQHEQQAQQNGQQARQDTGNLNQEKPDALIKPDEEKEQW